MQLWNRPLSQGSLTLAADARFSHVDYCDDHIWELKIDQGMPAVLGLSTTFGLRARKFILFPQFSEDMLSITDPLEFFQPPLIHFAYPNFARLQFSPFEGLDVEMDYWVAESHAVWGRIRISNVSALVRRLHLAWVAMLIPLEMPSSSGSRMAATNIQRAPLLWGRSSTISPIVCMRGEAKIENVPYPALCHTIELQPGASKDYFWAEAACKEVTDSYNLARSYLNRNWEAELARLMLSNSAWIDIQCGDSEWNAAFALTQQIGLSLFIPPNQSDEDQPNAYAGLPNPSLVLTRHPDQGFSMRGDGSDYGYAWSGQAVMDVYYAASLLLPLVPHLFQGLLLNYFAVQDLSSGMIDHRPGLGGQRSHLSAVPLLAYLTWKTYQLTQDKDFLALSVEPLSRYLQAWFTDHDLDIDGVPEWEHPLQFGFADHVIYSRFQSRTQGAQISFVESPALCAFLYHELRSMISICEELDLPQPSLQGRGAVKQVRYSELAEMIKLSLRSFWQPDKACFLYRDRDVHTSSKGCWLGERLGVGTMALNYSLPNAARLVFRLVTKGDRSQRPQVSIYGKDVKGNLIHEEVPLSQWRWVSLKTGHATTTQAFVQVDRVEVQNIGDEDRFSITSLDYTFIDLSLFLPLWGDLLPTEQSAALLVHLFDEQKGLLYPYGLGEYPHHWSNRSSVFQSAQDSYLNQSDTHLSMVWNTLIGSALLDHGYRKECAELVSRLMRCVTGSLHRGGNFYEFYNARTGEGKGEINSLRGLAPLGLFLQTLGVTLYSPWKVGLAGHNPFPWQVTISYRGLTIVRDADHTQITFPDGQFIKVDDPSPCIIDLESEEG